MNGKGFNNGKPSYYCIAENSFLAFGLNKPIVMDCGDFADSLFAHYDIIFPHEVILERLSDKIVKVAFCDSQYNQVFILTIEPRVEFSNSQEVIPHLEGLQHQLRSISSGQIDEKIVTVYYSVVSSGYKIRDIINHIVEFYRTKNAA